ncbi:HIT family protein [Methylophaga sp.]|jgi:diadenosine tetraphosphate (Ap4A) HIT family hydrolase|uniref:HIT domain-containing protein n=1 Tax=Methylophaga sp. TaxID=2024840 RepID=UPI001400B7C4|nr:HIT family protein [Methylophaga sp.]MTI64052.1 HIT domain-containing protein [Methylophaga sp.]
MYELHPKLAQDTFSIGEYELSEVRLMNDTRYPWVILVPKRFNVGEIYQLSEEEQQRLIYESSFTAQQMMELFSAEKMNVAAIGNIVEQLHLHHVARFTTDVTWPLPVWGIGEAQAYSDVAAKAMLSQLRRVLDDLLI